MTKTPFEILTDDLTRYMKNVVPIEAGVHQRTDTKLAFLAGAIAMFGAVTTISTENDDEAVRLIEDLRKRVMAYSFAVAAGVDE